MAQTTGQILYRDFEPDTCASFPRDWTGGSSMPGDTLIIDFNSDFIEDVMFYYDGAMPHLIWDYFKTCNQNTFVCSARNDTLNNSSLIWFQGPELFSPDSGEKFGFKIVDELNTYYGWYRGYRIVDDSLRYMCVDKIAFCTIQNYPLLWGQTEISNSVPKTDLDDDSVKINFNNVSNNVQIESLNKIKEVEIVSSSGQVVNNAKNIGKNNTEISASGLQSGVYIVKVSLEDGRVVSGKIVR